MKSPSQVAFYTDDLSVMLQKTSRQKFPSAHYIKKQMFLIKHGKYSCISYISLFPNMFHDVSLNGWYTHENSNACMFYQSYSTCNLSFIHKGIIPLWLVNIPNHAQITDPMSLSMSCCWTSQSLPGSRKVPVYTCLSLSLYIYIL